MFTELENKRQQDGITIDNLCKLIGISRITYYNWKSNKTSPTINQFKKLCKVLKIKSINII